MKSILGFFDKITKMLNVEINQIESLEDVEKQFLDKIITVLKTIDFSQLNETFIDNIDLSLVEYHNFEYSYSKDNDIKTKKITFSVKFKTGKLVSFFYVFKENKIPKIQIIPIDDFINKIFKFEE